MRYTKFVHIVVMPDHILKCLNILEFDQTFCQDSREP